MKHIIKILAALIVLGMFTTACELDSSTAGDTKIKDTQAADTDTDTDTEEEEVVAEPPPPPPKHHLVKSDVKVTPRIKSKQCFGSAGCSVEVAVSLGWNIQDPGKLDGTYDVTYRLTGDEDGPVIETLTVYPNGKYDVPYDTSVYPPSSSTPINAIVMNVTKIG